MIVTTVEGGLGNQLFMYAAARAMSIRLGTGLVLNTDKGFRDDWQFNRYLELQHFPLSYKESRFLTFDYRGGGRIQNISRKLGRNILLPHYYYITDNTANQGIDKRLFQVNRKNVYLEGYWQSETYFEDCKQTIRNDLNLGHLKQSEILKKEVSDLLSTKDKIPVGLCVRRYQECKIIPSFGIIDADFYIQAMGLVASKLNRPPLFYVFSQDIEWVKENVIRNCNYEFNFVQEKQAVEDLYLLSKFNYHIISNSSFYWWGAWLANGRLVVSNTLFCNKHSNLNQWVVI